MTETKSSRPSRQRIEVITSTGSGSKHTAQPSILIVENNSQPYKRLVFKDSHYRLEISNVKTPSSRKHITVVKVGRRRHHKHNTSTSRAKHRDKRETTLSKLPEDITADKAESPAWRRVLDKGLATAKKVFQSSKDDAVPLFPTRQKKFRINYPASITNIKMSSESVPVTEEQTKTDVEQKGAKKDPVVVRVVSDHAAREKKAESNGQKQDGGLTVPDDSEKKRRSMETLTAKMDFGDDEDED